MPLIGPSAAVRLSVRSIGWCLGQQLAGYHKTSFDTGNISFFSFVSVSAVHKRYAKPYIQSLQVVFSTFLVLTASRPSFLVLTASPQVFSSFLQAPQCFRSYGDSPSFLVPTGNSKNLVHCFFVPTASPQFSCPYCKPISFLILTASPPVFSSLLQAPYFSRPFFKPPSFLVPAA